MTNLFKAAFILAVLAFPGIASAQSDDAMMQKDMMRENCPMAAQMQDMHKEMGSMMQEMGSLMKEMSGPADEERMQTMRSHTEDMMAHMQEMHTMMGEGMMGGDGMMMRERGANKMQRDMPQGPESRH